MFVKGINRIHFTAERQNAEITREIASHVPGGSNDGSTRVRIVKGSIFKPEDMEDLLVWDVTKDAQTSPKWTVRSEVGFRPPLDAFDDISTIDEQTRHDIAKFLGELEKTLAAKDISAFGLVAEMFNDSMRQMGMTSDFVTDVLKADHYESHVITDMNDLKLIHGKKTIMVYCGDQRSLFEAGRSSDAPREDGKMYMHLSGDSLFFVKREGKIEPLWPKKY